MPTELEPAAARRTGVRVLLSPICELQFALFILQSDKPGKWKQAWVASFFRDQADLARRVNEFWKDEGLAEWGEILLLAHHGDVVFEESLDTAWEPLLRAAAVGLTVPPLPAEQPAVRPALQARIDRLSRSPELRERHIALLREVWNVLEPSWQRTGRAAAEALASQIRQQLPTRRDFREVLPPHHFVWREPCADVATAAADRGDMVIVPLGLAGAGVALYALPDLVIAALGPDAVQDANARRERAERAERAATTFKLFSDPTRCAILSGLTCDEASITDLAAGFGLSQPTLSVHVKALREAGLLDSTKVRGQTRYKASPERTRALLTEATDALLGEALR
jgi:ArsR family transcriptional regulator